MRLLLAAVALVGLSLTGCSSRGSVRSTSNRQRATTIAKPDGWILTTHEAGSGAPALLWNGLIGVRIARNGGGLGPDGKPLGFYMIDEYEHAGEEKILPLPDPILVTWAVGNELSTPSDKTQHDPLNSGGTPLDPAGSDDYSQSLDMRNGVLTTKWGQQVADKSLTIVCEAVVHPTQRVLAQRWTVTSSKATSFSIRSLDYGGPNDPQISIATGGGIDISASKTRVVTMATALKSVDAGALFKAQGFRIQEGTLRPGTAAVFERVLSFGAHADKPLPEFSSRDVARLKTYAPRPYSFDEVHDASVKTWTDRWKTDIQIDGPVEDQQAVRSFLFYLRSAIAPNGPMAVSPFGLSDSKYNGHVFWDADIWVFPALALIDPDAAKAVPAYRIAKARQAARNFADWFEAGAPTAKGPQRQPGAASVPPPGLKYPWESSVSGAETCLADSRFEDHITGSVLWALTTAADLGLAPRDTADGASALGANFYMTLGRRGPQGLSIEGVMSPDESHTGNNDLYTDLLAQWLTNGRRWTTPPHPAFALPRDATGLLTYDADPLRSYKQAAAILSIYPLQYPPAEASAPAMMDRFASKVIKNGPAMSDSLDALIWARLRDPRAYDAWKRSWQDFTKEPLMLFSEKRVPSANYFTTGAAGSLQAVLYGFLGFRIDSGHPPDAVWLNKLLGASVLSLRPNLPPQWKAVKLTNFSVLGKTYTLTVTQSSKPQVVPGDR